jgi:hypothetical protein
MTPKDDGGANVGRGRLFPTRFSKKFFDTLGRHRVVAVSSLAKIFVFARWGFLLQEAFTPRHLRETGRVFSLASLPLAPLPPAAQTRRRTARGPNAL